MNTIEFGAGYALLAKAYADQLKELSDTERKERRDTYAQMLQHMDGALWQEVIGVAIQSSKWFPKISELIAYAAELSRLRVDATDADAAFELALRAVRRLDPISHKPMLPVREDVERAVRFLGGWQRLALVEHEQLGWYRKEFVSAWNGRNEIVARLSVVNPALAGASGGPGMLGAGHADMEAQRAADPAADPLLAAADALEGRVGLPELQAGDGADRPAD